MTRNMLRDLETRYGKLIRERTKSDKNGEEEQGGSQEPVMKKVREEDEEEVLEVREQVTVLMSGTRSKVYCPLLSRPTCGE